MPIDDESLDAVVSFHVLEHVDSPAEFLRHVNRILRPGGLVHLEVPNLARWGEGGLDHFFQFPHLFSFTETTLRNYLTAIGGFRPIYIGSPRSQPDDRGAEDRPGQLRSAKPAGFRAI